MLEAAAAVAPCLLPFAGATGAGRTLSPVEDWLTAAARARPDHEAVVAGARSLTYAELDERAAQRARELAAAGVRAGDRVPVTHPPGLAFAELLHALPRVRRGARARARPRSRRSPPRTAPARPARVCAPRSIPDAVHTVIRTSGTTGAPKPVELTYANHAASARASADALGVEPRRPLALPAAAAPRRRAERAGPQRDQRDHRGPARALRRRPRARPPSRPAR